MKCASLATSPLLPSISPTLSVAWLAGVAGQHYSFDGTSKYFSPVAMRP
jgi:hypothetical protein